MGKIKLIVVFSILLIATIVAIKPTIVFAVGDADLGGGTLGPNIRVGLYSLEKRDLKENAFKINANREYLIRNKSGSWKRKIPAGTQTNVKYLTDKKFLVYNPETDKTIATIANEIFFESVNNDRSIIFDINKPNTSFDHYRGKIRLRYYDSHEADQDRIWIINILPLEQYTWGMGEITGTGHKMYNRVMTTVFRTYGYWKIKYSTKYADKGFHVDTTSGSQIYYGYDWEKNHFSIKEAAQMTQGKIVMYKNEIALTPYSSWNDGSTRNFENGHWGRTCVKKSTVPRSKIYPWLSAVKDLSGKHSDKSTCILAQEGNHMVGLTAHGALKLANKGWKWSRILTHYYTDVKIVKVYQ